MDPILGVFAAQVASKVPEKLLIWQFDGNPGNLRSQNRYSTDNGGNGYRMLCKVNNQYYGYKKQRTGINIGEVSSTDHKSHFRLPDGAEREILTGEPVAFGIGGGDAFLTYCNRTWGINLCWSATDPAYQWRFYDGSGEKGRPIPTNSWVALINVNVKPQADALVYLDRIQAANWGWTSSKDWKGAITDWITDEARKALMELLSS